MKDRFRFRVWNNRDWDNEFGQVYYDAEETYDFLRGNPQIPASYFGELLEDDQWIVEQCTGLKDKNGKLIYEGDILKPKGNTITKEVVYEDGSYWAKDTIYFHDKCHIFQKWIDECGYEIVGNIHEKESK